MGTNTEFANHLRHLRKAHGLSQQKLAGAADISYRHINFLENARAMPSRDMVIRIADTLTLSLKNTNLLLRSAGYATAFPTTSLDEETMAFAKTALSRILEQQNPYPGVVMTPIGDLIMANDAVFNLFSQFLPTEKLLSYTNVYELFLGNTSIKQYLTNWDQLAPRILSLVQQEVSEIDTLNEAYTLLRKLESVSGLRARDHRAPATGDAPLFTMHFKKDDLELSFFSTYTSFGTPHDVALQELRIECFFPANERTKSYCQHILIAKDR